MRRRAFLAIILAAWMGPLAAAPGPCQAVLQDLKLPRRIKTRGKPKMMRWEDIDKVLNEVDRRLRDHSCELRFRDLFYVKEKEEVWFPLTNSVVRLVPEESLVGLPVYTKEGVELGPFAGKVRYERAGNLYAVRSYSLYYFQYRGGDDKIHAVGERLLLDEFAIPWSRLQERTALVTGAER
ncbi:MAG: hypothetical protein Kow00109_27580 [Acidobacteriota bacterium]